MSRAVVLGVDSSTQSTKVVAVDLETGEELREGRASHTGENRQNPEDWWDALVAAARVAVTDDMEVRAISVAGQQHGLVTLDATGHPVRPAPLWNNVESADDAERLNALADFPAAIGSRLVASFTVTKLAHLARTAPDDLARTASICLPHDYLNWRLTGNLTTDRGDASGSGWWSPSEERVRPDLLALAVSESHANRINVPRVLGPDEAAGELSNAAASALGLPFGIPVGPGSGDNPAAAIGVGATDRELVVSLGTSGTAYAVSNHPTSDPTGEVAGFADATGRFLPLTCMLNCTRVFDSIATMFGIDRIDALERAVATDPGANGLLMLPYFDGERTPNLPNATGALHGLTTERAGADFMLRAAIDGVAAGIAYCIEALARVDVTAPGITLVGGGSRHIAWQQAIADATGLPVTVRAGSEHVARGAAIQAAAIARHETVRSLLEKWRPEILAEIEPIAGARDAFQLNRRRELIDQMRQEAN